MMHKEVIQSFLKTSFFGKYLYIFPELDSTNNYAKKIAQEGAPEGTVVLTEFQTGGRGQQGNSWQSSPGQNILMSIILRPRLKIESVRCITLATANILAVAIEKFLKRKKISGVNIHLKWPNDVYINDKKVAGILIESALQDKRIDFLIVGIGINVNQDISDLSDNIMETSTSLRHEVQQKLDREELTATLINLYEREYIRLESTNYHGIIREWKKRCAQIGKRVRIATPVTVETGVIRDVDESGKLLYETDEGILKELVSGSITNQIQAHGIND
jgi:BirA family biotin operon repressor/biotin-[acetyl-CoA-carboxylase] ligase